VTQNTKHSPAARGSGDIHVMVPRSKLRNTCRDPGMLADDDRLGGSFRLKTTVPQSNEKNHLE